MSHITWTWDASAADAADEKHEEYAPAVAVALEAGFARDGNKMRCEVKVNGRDLIVSHTRKGWQQAQRSAPSRWRAVQRRQPDITAEHQGARPASAASPLINLVAASGNDCINLAGCVGCPRFVSKSSSPASRSPKNLLLKQLHEAREGRRGSPLGAGGLLPSSAAAASAAVLVELISRVQKAKVEHDERLTLRGTPDTWRVRMRVSTVHKGENAGNPRYSLSVTGPAKKTFNSLLGVKRELGLPINERKASKFSGKAGRKAGQGGAGAKRRKKTGGAGWHSETDESSQGEKAYAELDDEDVDEEDGDDDALFGGDGEKTEDKDAYDYGSDDIGGEMQDWPSTHRDGVAGDDAALQADSDGTIADPDSDEAGLARGSTGTILISGGIEIADID